MIDKRILMALAVVGLLVAAMFYAFFKIIIGVRELSERSTGNKEPPK